MKPEDEQRIEKMLREAAPVIKQLDQDVEVPPGVMAKLREAKEKKFPSWKVLSAKEMESVLLKILEKQSMDGFELISRLDKAHIRIKASGEGVIYGLLSSLESAGKVEVELQERGKQTRKIYRLTEKGRGLSGRCKESSLVGLADLVMSSHSHWK